MSGSGNQVEVKITGTVDPSLGASAQAASAQIDKLAQTTRVSAKTMSDALKAAGGDISKITPEMMGLAAATQATAPAAASAATAIQGLGRAHTSTRAATESLVLVHEALQGRLTRMPGSLMILTQALTGASGTALLMGGAVTVAAGALAYLAIHALEAANAVDKIHLGTLGTQGFSASQEEIKKYISLLDTLPQVSSSDAEKIVATFANMKNRSQASFEGLSAATTSWAEISQQGYTQAGEQLSKAFGEPASAEARQFMVTLRGVTAAQVDAYDQAKRAGDIYGMQKEMLEALSNTIVAARGELDRHAASVHTNWRNTAEWIALIEGGMTTEQADSAMLEQRTAQYDKLTVAIQGAVSAMRQQQQTPQQKITTALLDADQVDTTRVHIEDLKAKIVEFQAALKNPDATEEMKKHFTSAIATADAEITSLSNKQAFKGTGFSNAGQELIAQAHETISEINADQTAGNAERLAEIKSAYAAILASGKLNAAQRLEVEKSMNEAITAEAKRAASEKRQIDQNDVQTSLELAKIGTDAQKQALEQQVAAGTITKQQELAQLIPILEEERDAKLKAISEAQQGYAADSTFFIEKENEKKVVAAQTAQQIADTQTQIAQEAARRQLAIDKATYSELASAENSFVQGMFSGRVGLLGALENLGRSFVEKEIEDDLHYYTARMVLDQAELNSDKSLSQQGLLLHTLMESGKTSATVQGNAVRTASDVGAASAGKSAQAASYIDDILADSGKVFADVYAFLPLCWGRLPPLLLLRRRRWWAPKRRWFSWKPVL